ncbi:hypothetical protein Hokovirus_3_295 [Hokovirus HKV1]|uniref:Uncharacterized protein n=1 Tax=Hokovirus HKV1 TaxID=1977638 RepID=A0A1V0SH31_9VIRU|nr:hypothetical protein Hokovirus_3_295 [Hokovirus HKV1]
MEFKDTEIKEPKLRNRNYVYLELLERQIKTRELFEKRLKKYDHSKTIMGGKLFNIFSLYNDTSIQNYPEYPENYKIADVLSKKETIILKQLLEENLNHDVIFAKNLEKHMCLDQEIYESSEKIKLCYLGFKTYYQIYEEIENYDTNKDYHDYIYCLNTQDSGSISLHNTTLFVFKVDNFDKKYIFYSNFSERFYKTNEFIKLDYIPSEKFEPHLKIDHENINKREEHDYEFNFFDDQNNNINNNDYFEVLNESIHIRNIEHSYNKNILIKGIQK